MTQIVTDDMADFIAELGRQEVAPKTIASYRSDLTVFGRWLEETHGEPFAASLLTPTDIRDYRAHLMTVEQRQPATVNRRLAALRRFSLWAKGAGLIAEL